MIRGQVWEKIYCMKMTMENQVGKQYQLKTEAIITAGRHHQVIAIIWKHIGCSGNSVAVTGIIIYHNQSHHCSYCQVSTFSCTHFFGSQLVCLQSGSTNLQLPLIYLMLYAVCFMKFQFSKLTITATRLTRLRRRKKHVGMRLTRLKRRQNRVGLRKHC